MIEQLLNDMELTKASLAEWQRKAQEATTAVQRLRGYLDGLTRAVEIAHTLADQPAGNKTDQHAEGAEQGSNEDQAPITV